VSVIGGQFLSTSFSGRCLWWVSVTSRNNSRKTLDDFWVNG